jgi:hypothetical protein
VSIQVPGTFLDFTAKACSQLFSALEQTASSEVPGTLAKTKKPPGWEAFQITTGLCVLYPDLLPTTISSSMLRSSTTIRLIMMMGFGILLIEMAPDSRLGFTL